MTQDDVFKAIYKLDAKLADKYSSLTPEVEEAIRPGLVRSITACQRLGIRPSSEAIKEIIEDGNKGNYHFLSNIEE